MGQEFELKYQVSEAAFDAIRQHYGPFASIEMETTYYETLQGDFGARRWTLRRRYENGSAVCTLKTPAAGHARNEWEVSAPTIEEAIGLLVAAGAPAELETVAARTLIALCGARFTRLASTITADGCTVELALDRGVLTGGEKAFPFTELEVELKSGSEAAAMAFANLLALRFDLTPEHRSKHHRALLLTRNDTD